MTIEKGYQPNFDLDLEYGQEGERRVDELLKRVFRDGARVEVKTERRCIETGNLYVEYECRGRDGEWRPSGIATTEADDWAFVISDTGVIVFFVTSALKYLARQKWRAGNRAEERDGSNPTRGVLLRLDDVPALAGRVPFGSVQTINPGDRL